MFIPVYNHRASGAKVFLGFVNSHLGDVQKAIEHYEQAFAIIREIKDTRIIKFYKEKLELLKQSS